MSRTVGRMTYDAPRVYRELIEPQYVPIASTLVRAVQPRSTERRLELGAGTGLLTELAAPQVRSILATDASEEMLAIARARVPGALFEVLDFTRPFPYPDGSFDLVLRCSPTVKEIARVLRPGGRFAAVQWAGGYREQRLMNATRRALVGEDFPRPSPARHVRRLEHAGFSVERRDFRLEPEHASVDDYLDYRRGFGRPSTTSEEEQERFLAELARRARPFVRRDGTFVNEWKLAVPMATLDA